MLIAFVQYIPNKTIYSKNKTPISIYFIIKFIGYANIIDVGPLQLQINGITIKNGNNNLYLHGSYSMSSAKPSKIVPLNINFKYLKL